MFTPACLPGLAQISSEWHAKNACMNMGETKPFQTKLSLLNKPGYLFMHGLVMLYERKAVPHRTWVTLLLCWDNPISSSNPWMEYYRVIANDINNSLCFFVCFQRLLVQWRLIFIACRLADSNLNQTTIRQHNKESIST